MGDSSSAPQALVTQAIAKIQKLASLISDFKDDDGISQQTLNSTLYVSLLCVSRALLTLSPSNEYISLLSTLEKASHPSLSPVPVSLLQ